MAERRILARGATADILEWEAGTVLKWFREWMPPHAAAHEAEISRYVQQSGLPVPAVGDLVTHEGRSGLVYQRVEGPTMLRVLSSNPWQVIGLARQLAELHAHVHRVTAPQLASVRERFRPKLDEARGLMSGAIYERAQAALDELPDGEMLCHGDFHPDNILLAAEGPVIIDWPDATRGDPASDVARTSLLLRMGEVPQDVPLVMRWTIEAVRRLYHAAYLRRYQQLRPIPPERIRAWMFPVVAARLAERRPEAEIQLILAWLERHLKAN